jgi:hypothetical protein
MAKLFTHHDPFHLHALLGGLALLHFLVRWALLLIQGTSWPEQEPLFSKISCTALHFVLPMVSLLLPVPEKRNFSAPMIWPEFRLHSLLFATRHVIATICSFCDLPEIPQVLGAVVLQYTTMCLASYITVTYGDEERRTTNAMPYPKYLSATDIQTTRSMYHNSQFLASSMAFCWTSPDLTYMPLLAIQIAPFCMTLVRKNKLTPSYHHCFYAWALWLNLGGLMSVLWHDPTKYREIMWSLLTFLFVLHLRITRGWSKYAAWSVGPLGAWTVVKVCQLLSPLLTMWLPNLQCPRVYWLLLRLAGPSLRVLVQNIHVLIPSWHLVPKNRATIITGVLERIVWMMSLLSDVIFYAGIALSMAVVLRGYLY